MNPPIFDSHTHIDMVISKEVPYQTIADKMRENNVKGFIQIGSDADAMLFSKQFCNQENDFHCYYTVGFHPSDAGKTDFNAGILFARENIKDKNLVAIGEVGLDYYYGKNSMKEQLEVFNKYTELALELKKPLCVHTRDAHEDTLQIISKAAKETKVLIHCFTGGEKEMRDYLELGCYISFSGIVTFNKAEELKQASKTCPLDKILIESDAPFLAPVPYRGKTNHPALILHTAKHIAQLRDLDLNDFCNQVYKNTKFFFNIEI
ncbi:MAG: TatD family hydrolase [Spirochaetia bacterium]|nr:TatD family hydrolase [Spirochaetia bacterium]